MTGVAVGAGRYVTVGCRGLDRSKSEGATWTSTDGETWISGNVENAGNTCMAGVISSPEGYVAWGFDFDRNRAAFWHSDDGNEWSRAPSIRSFAIQNVGHVVHIGDRFVAFSVHDTGQGEPEARIWVSPDGVSWSDQPDSEGCPGGQTSDPDRLASILSVLDDGIEIMAIGATFTEYVESSASPDPAGAGDLRVMGRSTDARCWDVTYTPTIGTTYESVLTADGIVGVGRRPADGSTGTSAVAASTSADGLAWTPSTFDPDTPEGALDLLATGDRGLLAMGPVDNGEPTEQGGDNEVPEDLPPPGTDLSAWWSADGRTWTRVTAPDAPTTVFADLTAIPGGFLVVGASLDRSGEISAQVWIGR
jgi:hypothetical protein